MIGLRVFLRILRTDGTHQLDSFFNYGASVHFCLWRWQLQKEGTHEKKRGVGKRMEWMAWEKVKVKVIGNRRSECIFGGIRARMVHWPGCALERNFFKNFSNC